MTSRQDKWVQVRQAELLKYVNGVEMLSKDQSFFVLLYHKYQIANSCLPKIL